MVASTAVLLLLLPPAQAFALAPLWVYEGKGDLTVKHIATYSTGVDWDEGGAEIVTYDAASKRLYVLSGAKRAVEIIDLSVLSSQDAVQTLTLTKQIKLEDLGISDPTSRVSQSDRKASGSHCRYPLRKRRQTDWSPSLTVRGN